MFLDKPNVGIIPFCSAVQKGQGIDFSPVVYDSNFESEGWRSNVSNHVIVGQSVKVPDGTSGTTG